jgi:hypothetical protein
MRAAINAGHRALYYGIVVSILFSVAAAGASLRKMEKAAEPVQTCCVAPNAPSE